MHKFQNKFGQADIKKIITLMLFPNQSDCRISKPHLFPFHKKYRTDRSV